MGMIDSLVGANSGNTGGAGLNYQAGAADLIRPVSEEQQKADYQRALESLNQQQQFISATAAQNGLANQASAYNQLQNYANGQGPNPALAQLQMATGQNSANQAAMMAGQRGASQNPALIARMAAQQGAANQQNAAGQGAALQAQQSSNALAGLGNLATQQVGQQANAINSFASGAQGMNQTNLNAIGQYNQAQTGSMASQNQANSAISSVAAKGQQDLIGGVTKGAAAAMAAGGEVSRYAEGGQAQVAAPQMAQQAPVQVQTAPMQSATGPRSNVGKFFTEYSNQQQQANNPNAPSGAYGAGEAGGAALAKGFQSLFGSNKTASPSDLPQSGPGSAYQDMADSMNSVPGADNSAMGDMISSMPAAPMADGGDVQSMLPMLMKMAPMLMAKSGAVVPGTASVKGDSLKNDKVPAILSPKEIVLPRSVTMAPDAPARAAEFVRQIQAGKHKKKK